MNKFIKNIAFVGLFILTFFEMFLTSLWLTGSLCSIYFFFASIFGKVSKVVAFQYYKFLIPLSIPLAIFLFVKVMVDARNKTKAIKKETEERLKEMDKEEVKKEAEKIMEETKEKKETE